MEEAIWGGYGLTWEVGMERGGGRNLGLIRVNLGSGNGEGWRRKSGVDKGLSGEARMEGGGEGLSREVGMEAGGGGNLGWRRGGGGG